MTKHRIGIAATAAAMLATIGMAGAQTVPDQAVPDAGGLNIPAGSTLLAPPNPNVRKATAVVNGEIITGTDVDQRTALIVAANGGQVSPEELQRLKLQVLSNLIDETLQIQEAKANDIKIDEAEVDAAMARVAAQNGRRSVKDFDSYLRSIGSSANSLKRQIRGELAWQRLLRRKVAPFVTVSQDEVKSIVDRLNAAKGSTEYRIGEIYLQATPETLPQATATAQRILEQLKGGGSFPAYARQFSQASTAAVGGDLGWVRPEQLPDTLAAQARQLNVGEVAGPIPTPGGLSIVALIDKRQVLTADPRDAVLSLKQIGIDFPKGKSDAELQPMVQRFADAVRTIHGCGQADQVAQQLGAQVVSRDNIHARELPPQLQQVMAQLQIGQATPPYGSLQEGIRAFVLCGRDAPQAASGPSPDQIMQQIEDERINKRALLYLRDLRRDAVIEYN